MSRLVEAAAVGIGIAFGIAAISVTVGAFYWLVAAGVLAAVCMLVIIAHARGGR